MDAPEPQRTGRSAAQETRPGARSASNGAKAPTRRRTRLARGPLTIGEPAPAVDVRLARASPYRPDTIADGGTVFGLDVRAASVRGLQKRYLGGPRQDDFCLLAHDASGTLLVAVADGVSGAPRSDLAAALAVRHAVAAAARQLDAGAVTLDWSEVFEQAAWALIEEHRRGADASAGVDEVAASLATTLLVAAVDGAAPAELDDTDSREVHAQLAAVGDSPAFVLRGGSFTPIVGETQSDDGLLGGGVQALPRAARAVEPADCALVAGDVLLLCTDGLALPLAGGTGDVGLTLARELARPPDVVDFARLLDFSRSTYDDDRTLVAIWLQG